MRDGDKRIVRLKEGEPRHRHVVIVDDLVQSGGTLIECQKLLASQVRRCCLHNCVIPCASCREGVALCELALQLFTPVLSCCCAASLTRCRVCRGQPM